MLNELTHRHCCHLWTGRAFVLTKFNVIVDKVEWISRRTQMPCTRTWFTSWKLQCFLHIHKIRKRTSRAGHSVFENHHKLPNNGIDFNGGGAGMKIFIPVWKKKQSKQFQRRENVNWYFRRNFSWNRLLEWRCVPFSVWFQFLEKSVHTKFPYLSNTDWKIAFVAYFVSLRWNKRCEWAKENKTSVDCFFCLFRVTLYFSLVYFCSPSVVFCAKILYTLLISSVKMQMIFQLQTQPKIIYCYNYYNEHTLKWNDHVNC